MDIDKELLQRYLMDMGILTKLYKKQYIGFKCPCTIVHINEIKNKWNINDIKQD